MSEAAAGGLQRLAEVEGVDPSAYAGTVLEAQIPHFTFLAGAQACIDAFGEDFARRFGPALPDHQAA